MYFQFFNLKEKPFRLAPDPKYLFLGKNHEEVLTHLIFDISQDKGSVMITGEAGIGKTTLSRAFFGNLDSSFKAAYISIPGPTIDGLQFLRALIDAFWIESTPDNTKEELVDKLKQFANSKREAGQKILFLIDEGQNLSPEALEQFDRVSDLEDSQGKLLKFILVGQPELKEMVSSSQAGRLKDQLARKYTLGPLTLQETIDYIKLRLSVAAIKAGPSFDKSACRAIYDYSKGIPKLINIVCEMALQKAFNNKIKKITGMVAREAIQTLTAETKPAKPQKKSGKPLGLAIISVALVVLALGFLYFSRGPITRSSSTAEPSGTTKMAASTGAGNTEKGKPEPAEKVQAAEQAKQSLKNNGTGTHVRPAAAAVATPAKEIQQQSPAVRDSGPQEPNAAGKDMYSVHAGAFTTVTQANQRLEELKLLGFPSFGYSSYSKNGETVHVVVAGKYGSIDQAKEASRTLSRQGYSNFISRAKDSLKIPAGAEFVEPAAVLSEASKNSSPGNKGESGDTVPENREAFSVHAGTFSNAAQANQLLNDLKSHDYPSFMYQGTNKKGHTVFNVVAGQYGSIDQAKEASRSLTEEGYANFIARAKDSLQQGAAK